MATDITGLHHVGIVVNDMTSAIDTFRQLGFHIDPPAYPALPPTPGGQPEPVGAGNTHADFPRGFIELLAFASDRREELPAGTRLVPLQVPDDQLAGTKAAINHTVAGLAARLARSEGAHILIFASADAERTATRLSAAGVAHTGARAAQRPITTTEGTSLAPIKYLEISDGDPAAPNSMLPEGRIGAVEDAPPELLDAQVGLGHPNGAIALSECVICSTDHDLDAIADRYARYLDHTPTVDGRSRSFELGAHRLTITTARDLAARLPGERPSTTPGLSAFTIDVADLSVTTRLLRTRGVELRRAATGDPFIPASAAHGAAIMLRQASTTT
ncbi:MULTISPECIES: VOC family protein [Glycomyces]|uniref:Catechol 2,3-dioxygenase-like lactoylglutathione lyase family enzyme n=2 Tax=Glycomyces TaxID=58113 RepID=A0A9X3TAZ6_9ACTN|nr:VOC family protein [Glycomyces lechevalierae]MDA1388378.1 VOC family protein [Glycomyces lechevalierae]MDR7340331.1 catechol 2,3-dioxygenase-like lactoylglutathione lyase family enzyme [Glycomyces lechevalierae]